MAARRHNRVAPYEVMGLGGGTGKQAGEREPAAETAEPEPQQGFSGAEGGPSARLGDAGQRLWDWARTGAAPIVLRVPRGLAVVALVGAILLLVLAYWVGYVQGRDAGEATAREQVARQEQALRQPPAEAEAYEGMAPGQGRSAFGEGNGGDGAGAGGGDASGGGEGDPREPGLNYLQLAIYPVEAAERLQAFLAERAGVETVLEPVHNRRGEFRRVIAVDQGFGAEAFNKQANPEQFRARQRYLEQLRQLGQQWQEHTGGHDALESMNFRKYRGE